MGKRESRKKRQNHLWAKPVILMEILEIFIGSLNGSCFNLTEHYQIRVKIVIKLGYVMLCWVFEYSAKNTLTT